MKSSLEFVQILHNRLRGATSISGGVYKLNGRPVNSRKEDIVISPVANINDQLQEAVLNVNVYVPDQVVSVNGFEETHANYPRLLELANEVADLLDDVWTEGDHYDVMADNVYPEAGEHFLNFRIKFYHVNL